MNGSQRIDLHWNLLARQKFMRFHTRNIKPMTCSKECHGGDGRLCCKAFHFDFIISLLSSYISNQSTAAMSPINETTQLQCNRPLTMTFRCGCIHYGPVIESSQILPVYLSDVT